MDGYSPDEIVKSLFERGVCSFVPYMLCAALEGEHFEEKTIAKQTQEMKMIPMSPAAIEQLISKDEELKKYTKSKIDELLRLSEKEDIHEVAREILNSIIVDNDCSGKTEGVYCLAKACKLGCINRQREKCIGCGFDMCIKSLFIELRLEICNSQVRICV